MKKILSAIGLVVGLSFLSAGLITAEEKGLVGYWKFDEGKGDIAEDSSGNGNDGTIHGATWVEGTRGKALKFDGKGDYVDCGNSENLNISEVITIEAWVRPNSLTGTYTIVSKHTPYFFQISVDKVHLGLWTIPNGSWVWRTGNISLETGKWQHVAFTWDDATDAVIVYVNGVSDSLESVEGPLSPISSGPVIIGSDRPLNDRWYWNGTIDEVKIYNRALTEEEIKNSYQKTEKVFIEKEKKEKQAKLKALSSLLRLKGLRPLEGSLFSSTNFSVPKAWNYQKIYGKPFYFGLRYHHRLWKDANVEQEPFIKDSLLIVSMAYFDVPSSPVYQELLDSDNPIISFCWGNPYQQDFFMSKETFKRIKEDFGPRYLGCFNSFTQEWTRLWVYKKKHVEDYVTKELGLGLSSVPKDRKEALEIAGTLFRKRFAKYTPGQKQYQIQATLQDHFAMSLPEVVIEGVETTGQCGQFPAQTASARGASRQYQKPYACYMAVFVNADGPCVYNVPFPECYYGGAHIADGPYYGLSPSLQKRTFYAGYMGGANLLEFEGDTNRLIANYDFRTIEKDDHLAHLLSDKRYWLSPLGYDFKEFYDNVVLKHDRGIPYAPVGLLFDKYHNLNTPYSWDCGIGVFPYTDADYMMRAVINSIWPWEEGKFRRGGESETFCMVTSSFGDIFDIVTNDKSTLDNLKNYPVLFMVGNVDIDKTFYNRLVSYVKKGGNLFINIEQINDLFTEDFLGVKLSKSIHQGSSFYSLLDGEMSLDKDFTFREVIPVNAKPVIISPDYDNLYPLVTVNNYGKGKVFLTTPYYLYIKGSKNKMLNLFSYLMKEISKGTTPVSVEGNVEYLINRNKNGWVLTLINNEGVTKLPRTKAVIDEKKKVEVRITFNKDFNIKKSNEWTKGKRVKKENGSFRITVPPGDIRIVEFKGEQL